MHEIAFILSGEDLKLAERELKSVLISSGIEFKEVIKKRQLVVLILDEFFCPYITFRCAMVKLALKIIYRGKIEDFFQKKNFEGLNTEESYYVDIHSFETKYKNLVPQIRFKIVSYLNSLGFNMSVKNPTATLYGYIINEDLYLGILISRINNKAFESRRPSKRPFFHSSSMMPKLARCLVNLSEVEINKTIVDPFCGSGGFLIEASFFTENCIGIDIDRKMVKGALKNLKHFSVYNADLIQADAEKIPLRKIEYIATDMPYGIAASLKGRNESSLLNEFLKCVESFKGLKISLATTEKRIDNECFKVDFNHVQKVRGKLFRYIYVLKNIS